MTRMTYGHKYGPTNTELWIRPGRVDLALWDETTLTISLTPGEAEQLAEVLSQAGKEAKQ